MSFAPPIARDGFHYNGDLYVDVGNLNRHKRASIAEITAILRPDLKQSKAVLAASPSKDPVGHWYEAQLIHYGLQPSKDKARAKMRLLEAVNTSSLAVPAAIAKLEAQLKKEYTAAERKAKAQYKAELATTEQSKPTTGVRKRKQPEPTTSVSVNINFGPYAASIPVPQMPTYTTAEVAVEGKGDQPPKKKAKTSVNAAKGPKERVKAAKNTPASKKSVTSKGPGNGEPRRVSPIQTAKWSGSGGKEANIHQDTALKKPSMKKESRVKAESPDTSAETVRPKQISKRTTAVKKEPAIKKESAPRIKNEYSSSQLPKLGLINGHYEISCPDLSGQLSMFDDHDMSLILCLDSPSVWGAYDFGMFSGILRIEERPWESSHEPISLQWRGRENSEGQMSFGDSCTGEIIFLGAGRIEGWLSVYGQCWFSGARIPGPGSAPRTAASLKQEWNGYNQWA